jgi:hypothetical protein
VQLYYTTNGPHPELAGSEEPFPGPDNQSKMKRSCENAEHVGKIASFLYLPCLIPNQHQVCSLPMRVRISVMNSVVAALSSTEVPVMLLWRSMSTTGTTVASSKR